MKDARSVEALIQCLRDTNTDVQAACAHALETLGDKRAIEPLVTLVNAQTRDCGDPDYIVRFTDSHERLHTIAHTLAVIGQNDAVQPLFDQLTNSPNQLACTILAKELASIGAQAVPALLEALANKGPHVRRCAAIALGSHPDKRSLLPLIKALRDSDDGVRKEAAEALRKRGWRPETVDQRLDMVIAQKDWSRLSEMRDELTEELRTRSTEAMLAEFNYRPAFDPIGWEGTGWSSCDLDWHARNKIAYQLRDLAVLTVPTLIRSLSNTSDKIRNIAADVLLHIGTPSLSPLTKYLTDTSKPNAYSEPIPEDTAERIVDCLTAAREFKIEYEKAKYSSESIISTNEVYNDVVGVNTTVSKHMIFRLLQL
jgi:HEAT repeat protein